MKEISRFERLDHVYQQTVDVIDRLCLEYDLYTDEIVGIIERIKIEKLMYEDEDD